MERLKHGGQFFVAERKINLLNSFDASQWEEEDLNINSTELGSESQRIVQLRYFPLGMDLEYLKKEFPITYELIMIMCLQNLLIEYTKNQGSWSETPSNGLVTIFQENEPFACKEYSMDLDLENNKHMFRILKQNNVMINSFPDLRVLLSAGYINKSGRLRKYEKTVKELVIGKRVIKKSKNIAVRPGWKRRKTYVDIIKHTEKGTRSELDFTIEDMKSEERSQQNCRCQETSEMPALHAQICYTEEFYDKTRVIHLTDNVDRDFTRIIEKEINQLPERLSNKAMIGEEIEEVIKRGYNTIACYIAGNPVVAPSMFTSFEKFGDVGENTGTWKLKDMEQLLNMMYADLKNWKQICSPWCFTVLQKKEFKIHYLDNHKDNIIMNNTCDMIKSNHRAYISLLLFLIICLEDKVQISYSEEMNKLKQRIEKLDCKKEINSKAPGYEELKRR